MLYIIFIWVLGDTFVPFLITSKFKEQSQYYFLATFMSGFYVLMNMDIKNIAVCLNTISCKDTS